MARAPRGLPTIILSIFQYQVDALGSALTLKADLTPGQTMRYALLHAAAANGQLEMARELLERGANVDVLGSGGETACGQSASLGSAPQPGSAEGQSSEFIRALPLRLLSRRPTAAACGHSSAHPRQKEAGPLGPSHCLGNSGDRASYVAASKAAHSTAALTIQARPLS